MLVLVANVGSTSLKYDVYDMTTETSLAKGRIERLGAAGHSLATEVQVAFARVVAELTAAGIFSPQRPLAAIGHRVVHGGERLVRPTRVDDEVLAIIEQCAEFAPLHNPANAAGIRAAMAAFPSLPHVAVFDTAFHAQLPAEAFRYPLPEALYLQHGLRRYGFHGPSHQYMAAAAAEFLQTAAARLKLVTCHLGGGASMCAIEHGVSVDTSMGLTPLEGLMMGTRPGDLDPGLLLWLQRAGHSAADIEQLLHHQAGVAGVWGKGSDFRDLVQAADSGDTRAQLAFSMYVYRVRKYVGAYAAALGGMDALVFSGGIGEHSAVVRARVCEPLTFLGVVLDAAANETAGPHPAVRDIATRHSPTRVLVVAAEEEKMIAREVVRCLHGPAAAPRSVLSRPIPVGVSVRHVHLSRSDCDALFGPGYELTKKRDVTQPGQYVTRETVDLVGPKGELYHVAIIAPLRSQTQVEVAKTDAIRLGVDPPLRESGQLAGTPGLTLRGPHGTVQLTSGVILAHRHVHMHPSDAARFGVRDKDSIVVRVGGERETALGDVIVRVSESFALDLHVDTDEANATGLTNDSVVAFEGRSSSSPE